MHTILLKELKSEFNDKDTFSRDQVFRFFQRFEPNLKEGTFGWRIYDLKQKKIIKSVKRGVYTLLDKSNFHPEPSPTILKLSKKIAEKYAEIKYCLLDTAWLNEFSIHQSTKQLIVIDIEKEFVDSLFYHLKDHFKYDIYINPDNNEIDYYIAESQQPIIIRKLITRAPLETVNNSPIDISIPSLEKILVDLFADEKLFHFYQGAELSHIYENTIKTYAINYTTLFSYAKRREREDQIRNFIKEHMNYLVKDIIDD